MITAKAEPVEHPHEQFAADDPPGIAATEIAGGKRAHRHRHGLRAGVAAHAGDDRHEDGERHHLADRMLELAITHAARSAVTRLANSQGKRLRTMDQTESDSSSSPAHAAERLDVLLCFLLDHVDDVVDRDDADQPVTIVDHRRGYEIVALELARHLFLVIGCTHSPALRVHQLGDRHRPLGAQQAVERDGALQAMGRIDDVEFVEALRQVGGLAHVVDGLPDRPERRHRDEFGLHAPPGGILRVVQDALDRDALGRRQLLEDFGLFLLRQVLDDVRGIIGIELAHAFGNGLRLAALRGFPRGPCRRPR